MMNWFWTLLVCICLVALAAMLPEQSALAQDTSAEPAVAAEEPAGQPVRNRFGSYIRRSQEQFNVFIFGDRISEGLAAGLKRYVHGNDRYRILPRGKAGTGLARPDRYDWHAAIGRILERQRVDIAIILVGSNDTGSVSTPAGRYNLGSDLWRQAYVQYVDRILDQLRAAGTAVYWVELPPMARADYDRAVRQVTEVQRERVNTAQMRFIPVRETFSNPDGSYTDRGLDVNGEEHRLRTRDGVRFLRRGNDKVAKIVMAVVERDVEAAETGGLSELEPVVVGEGTAAAPAEVTEVRSTVASVPIFGQVSESGAALRVDLGPEITLVRTEPGGDGSTGLNATVRGQGAQTVTVSGLGTGRYAPAVVPGTVAAGVLLDGNVVESRPGRADDFSWPRQ